MERLVSAGYLAKGNPNPNPKPNPDPDPHPKPNPNPDLFVGGLGVEEVTAGTLAHANPHPAHPNPHPSQVTAMTHRSEESGADLTDAALIRCSKG